jgi:hypothetical protein
MPIMRPRAAKITIGFMAHNSIERAPQLIYAPDWGLSVFYFFGFVNQLAIGHEFTDREARISAVKGTLEAIQTVNLEQIFRLWMDRLVQCIAIDGESAEEPVGNENRG